MSECSCCNVLDNAVKLLCEQCKKIFHPECLKNGRPSPIEGDTFFHLVCAECHTSGNDVLTRIKLPWVTVVHLSLYNLQLQGSGKRGFYKWKDSICTYIDRHWHNFFPCDKKKSATWNGTIAGTLSNGAPQYFTSGSSLLGEAGWWKLADNKPPPIEQLQPSNKIARGKSIYKEPSSNVINETGRSSRTKVSSIQAAMELKARRDNTMEAKEIKKRRTSTTKRKLSIVKAAESEATPDKVHCKEPPHMSHLVSILLPLPVVKRNSTVKSEDSKESKAVSDILTKKTSYSETVSALLGDKESDSDNEIDPCSLSSDEIACDKHAGISAASESKNESNQEWEEIMAPFCNAADTITEGEGVFVKEEPISSAEYGTYGCSQDQERLSSLEETSTTETENTVDIPYISGTEEDVSSHSNYQNDDHEEEYNIDIKKEANTDSRPSSSLAYGASESEREENTSYDISRHQSEADNESENEEMILDTPKHRKYKRTKQEKTLKEPEPPKKDKYIGMSVYEEKQLLSRLQSMKGAVDRNPEAARFRRKLLLRELKRQRGIPCFDLDGMMNRLVGQRNQLYGLPVAKPHDSSAGLYSTLTTGPSTHNQFKTMNILDRFQTHHSVRPQTAGMSFLNKLVGTDDDQLQCIRSPYTSRLLKPFIRRDYETRPAKINLLMEIQAYAHRNNPKWTPPDPPPIDYCYVQPQHIPSVNALCREFFWPGIDLSECLEYPDFSCVVLYRKFVIGFSFMVPDVDHHEAYISFLFTHPEWRRAGIAKFMVYHLIQTCMGKDITLHVSANNPAMLLYQKFGFKPEEFILDFYDKYFPATSKESRHAFYLRLRR